MCSAFGGEVRKMFCYINCVLKVYYCYVVISTVFCFIAFQSISNYIRVSKKHKQILHGRGTCPVIRA